jgi:hypothetical protein
MCSIIKTQMPFINSAILSENRPNKWLKPTKPVHNTSPSTGGGGQSSWPRAKEYLADGCNSSFGCLRFAHFTIDTYAGFTYAFAHSGEATKHVIAWLLLLLWVNFTKSKQIMGLGTHQLLFMHFASHLILHSAGIPYNPQGQAIVE